MDNKPIEDIIQDHSSDLIIGFLKAYKQLIYCPIVFAFFC